MTLARWLALVYFLFSVSVSALLVAYGGGLPSAAPMIVGLLFIITWIACELI